MKIKCVNDDKYVSIVAGKTYEARRLTDSLFAVVDESGDEFGYPAELFEVMEE